MLGVVRHLGMRVLQVSDTNKAQFRTHDGKVRKRYLRKGDAARDYALLRHVSESFQAKDIGGWTYRPLTVYAESDHEELVMEAIDGSDVDAIYAAKGDPSVFRHAGRWLGVLHSNCDHEGLVPTFNDYNRSNVVLDSRNRVAVALDPGVYEDTRSHPSVSIVIGAFSIFRGTVCRGMSQPFRSVREFTRGYFEGLGREELPKLRPGRRYLIGRLVSGQSRTLGSNRALRHCFGAVEAFVVCGLLRLTSVYRSRTSGI